MKKFLKFGLKIILSIVVLIIIGGTIGYFYISGKLLTFEKDYSEDKMIIKEITVDGKTFLDRNGNGQLDIYEDDQQPIDARVNDLLSQMTTEEKIHLLKGSGLRSAIGLDKNGIPGAVGTIVPTPRLGIPTVYLSDGPAGLRIEPKRKNDDNTYYCTAFPIGTLLASTWNVDLVEKVGNAMGNEAKEYGLDVILGPGANIHRHPLCGRNFEYYSEDPVLTGNIGAAMVNGIESNGIGTSVKHFVANSQETNRNWNDAIISERALREIYLKGFEIIVKKAQPWTIMSSYNKVNGTYTSESKFLLTDVIRDDWGFEGIVMSDWFAKDDPVKQVSAGNDLLEPGTKPQWDALKEGYENGTLTMETIDTSVKRILKLILQSKKMKGAEITNSPDLEKHAQITRQSASEGMVLLKNQQTLPLQNIKNIALIGVTSYDFIAGGTGSGDVNEAYSVSLEEGLINAGFEINETAKSAFEKHKAAHKDEFVKPEGFAAMFNPYTPPELSLPKDLLEETASTSDMAIITIGRNSGEGGDRHEKDDFLLTSTEQEMIKNTCDVFHAAGKKVVVVMNIGGVIETASWRELPDAILLAWQGGQEGGNSAADILVGNVNPSGKLPMTFPIQLNDHAANANFPLNGEHMNFISMIFSDNKKSEGEELEKNIDFTNYEEGIYVGYRHFDKAKLKVAYPFGYGLSYSDFSYGNSNASLVNDSIMISVSIKNLGDIDGKEVVQVYASKPDTNIDRPIQELKAFAKTPIITAGDSVGINFTIPVSDLSYWDENTNGWVVEPGQYIIQIGSSSRDIRLSEEVKL